MQVVMPIVGGVQSSTVNGLQQRTCDSDTSENDALAEKCTKRANQNNRPRTALGDDEDSFLAQAAEKRKRLKQQTRLNIPLGNLAKKNTKSSCDRDSSPAFPSTEEELIERGIRRLDEEYAVLDATKETLLSLYCHLRSEEKLLREAFQYASETPKEKRARIIAQQRMAAEARLKQALFNFDDEDKSDVDDDR